jgi:hypothetical protein
MKIETFQLRGNNSLCAVAFQLLRGRVPAQLRGNIVIDQSMEAVSHRKPACAGTFIDSCPAQEHDKRDILYFAPDDIENTVSKSRSYWRYAVCMEWMSGMLLTHFMSGV